mmetsp:Transcript_20461/g.72356  ORF Transcript_20461/g.72356 Transcript_20461/m.72356 type:complete len:186 (-) Transcript_20461:195-752(-)
MAFFGLTQLGTQSAFAATIVENLGITVFSDEELRKAFDKLDKDGSATIEGAEFDNFLREVYRGPPPEGARAKLMAEFDVDRDGKVTWDEFRITVQRLRNKEERERKEEEKTTESHEFRTASEMRESMRRHKRVPREPNQKFVVPVTTSQAVGWGGETGVTEVRYPKVSCEETKYAASMAQSGVFY